MQPVYSVSDTMDIKFYRLQDHVCLQMVENLIVTFIVSPKHFIAPFFHFIFESIHVLVPPPVAKFTGIPLQIFSNPMGDDPVANLGHCSDCIDGV